METLLFSLSYRMGCGALGYREQAQEIELKTGGLFVSPHITADDSHLDMYEQVNADLSLSTMQPLFVSSLGCLWM